MRESNDIRDEPLLGVWNSAIQVHPYQLEAVIRALCMLRVCLLLADGVGLGKTIQAGLVLEELLLRRRIRRVLVICPAMLQRQWQIELARKFNLNFEIIDSDLTFQLRRRMGIDTNPWKTDRLRLRVEIDALCADLYGLDPDDFDWIVRDDPKDPNGFYRVDRQLPFRERLTGLSAAAFRALKEGKWSPETAGQLSNDEFFEILGIPELTSATAAKAKGLAGPLILKRDGCHSWHPENFPSDDPRHGWTWDDCRQDAITLLGSEKALEQYIAQMVDGSSSLVSGNENPTTNDQQPPTKTDLFGAPLPTDLFGNEIRPKKKRRR